MTDGIGPSRRKDDVRIALLEQSMGVLKTSVDLLHTHVAQNRAEHAVHLDAAVNTIVEKIDKKWEDCAEHKERTAKSESSISYHLINAGATWAAVVGLGSWLVMNMVDMKEILYAIMHIKGTGK